MSGSKAVSLLPAGYFAVTRVTSLRDLAYLVAAALFIFDLKLLAHPRTAVRGNVLGVIGMLIAIVATIAGQPMSWK